MSGKLKVSEWIPLVVSVAALLLAVFVELRGESRFKAQLDQADKIAKAQVRPLIDHYALEYIDKKGVVLCNRGAGAAVITKVSFRRDKLIEDALVDLYELGTDVVWADYYMFGDRTVVKSGDEIPLVLLTQKVLEECGLNPQQSSRVMAKFEEQSDGVVMRIEYEDVLGNAQPPYAVEL